MSLLTQYMSENKRIVVVSRVLCVYGMTGVVVEQIRYSGYLSCRNCCGTISVSWHLFPLNNQYE